MSDKKHFFLMSFLIVYTKGVFEKTKPINVLVTSDTPNINRELLALSQNQAANVFTQKYNKTNDTQIDDVYVASTSYFGEMTQEEFHGSFLNETEQAVVNPDPQEPVFAGDKLAPEETQDRSE